MDFAALFQIALFQIMSARDAPLPVALAALVAGLVAWRLTRWRSAAVVQNLKRGLARRDAELDKLRAHIPLGADADADVEEGVDGDPAPERRPAPRSTDQRLVRTVVNAIDQAALAIASNDGREIDRAQSSMGLALQTVNRQLGLPVPVLTSTSADSLSIGKRYLEDIRPALRAGDEAAAQRAAAAFVGADDLALRSEAG